ncbi:cation channel sperm-associated auxiliary subunit TMEM249-like isoform X2 [Apostichopus japonicus]|uniref:cation channel sperm-associated auxiliary subunit TMEM249-like isoform X2 n=1 Tax=Stichopus japonicus TaxID=307972 RepID=UPI003AB50990
MSNDRKIVGIFGTWDYSFWAKPEDIFQARLEKNPIFPFEETEENHYEYEFISIWFWFSLATIAAALVIGGIVMLAVRNPMSYLVCCIICVLVSAYTAYVYQGKRKVVIDHDNDSYTFYRKGRRIYTGHVHNIYIRLVGQKGGNGEIYYKVVLNGFNLEVQALSSSTLRCEKLEKLGRRLATRLNLNFFDWTDRSTRHVIRHRCPYVSKTSTLAGIGSTA